MLCLTRKTDYALIALGYLAERQDRVVAAREISRAFELPEALLMNILKRLLMPITLVRDGCPGDQDHHQAAGASRSDHETARRGQGGGCSGFSYMLDLTEESKGEADEEMESQGIKILCDMKSYLYLNGTEIDFKDEVMGRGFVFKNPNATSTCGCGSSFTA
jgi:iron-sulfur cluster assembly protein